MKLSEIKENWPFIENIGSISYWLEQTNDGSGKTIGPEEVLEIGCQLEAENEALEKQGDYWCDLYKHKRAEHIATCLSKRWEIDALKGLLKRIREHSTDKHYWGQEIDALLKGSG